MKQLTFKSGEVESFEIDSVETPSDLGTLNKVVDNLNELVDCAENQETSRGLQQALLTVCNMIAAEQRRRDLLMHF